MIPGTDPQQLSTPPGRLVGVYPALVTDVQDPDGQGRVQVSLPFVNGTEGPQAAAWARLATFMAGADRGSWFIPEVNDEVLVAFLAGDARHPVVIGALWNGVDAPPETMDAGNNLRSITSRSGHRLLFDDSLAAEKVVLETQGGHRLTLDDAAGGTVTLSHSNGASVTIDVVGKVTVTAISEVAINAPAGMTVTAPTLRVQAAMADFTGVVRTGVLITGSVVCPSYTPGLGNLL
jgi:uncharacterized protein involved in type VI secretion and phage assembly